MGMMAGITVRESLFAALDFESAGERANEAGVPVQIGIAWMSGLDPDPSSFYGSYLRADRPVTWRCTNCGWVTTAQEPPNVCPVCDHPQGYFQQVCL